jgi:phosphotransferase family enzyme
MPDKPGTARAFEAARLVATANGVACDDAVVLAAGSNVLVHLKPSPVVARVMTGTAALHGDMETWLSREVAVGTFLGARELAVAPSDLIAPGPYEHDGLWMTFWEFIELDPSAPRPTAGELGRSLRALHDALASFPGELGPLSDIRDWLDGLADGALRARLRDVSPTVFETSLPTQAIHGDASIGNLLRTDRELLWNDLEDVCEGPVHWDIAGLVAEARDTEGGEAFIADFLAAYGGPSLGELEDFIVAHDLYVQIWQAQAAQ